MEQRHLPQRCKWAEQTLLQPMPLWLEAWTRPWCCLAQGEPRLLDTSDECAQCPCWEERKAEPAERTPQEP